MALNLIVLTLIALISLFCAFTTRGLLAKLMGAIAGVALISIITLAVLVQLNPEPIQPVASAPALGSGFFLGFILLGAAVVAGGIGYMFYQAIFGSRKTAAVDS